MNFSHERYAELIEVTVAKIQQLSRLKGGEYSGDIDRLANFRRNALALDLEMEQVWAVYAAKHWDALIQYIKDMATETTRDRMEPIDGRVDDLLVYLILFKAMLLERDDQLLGYQWQPPLTVAPTPPADDDIPF